MKATIIALALLSTTSQAFDPKARIQALERALQEGPPDNANVNAANITVGSDGAVTVITGSGVQDAELPSEGGGDDEPTNSIEVPNYTEDECAVWLNKAFSADDDGSNGLGEGEFQDFLLSIEEPPYVAEYFQQFKGPYGTLPWMFKVVHKSLACRCQDLGLGNECCEGEDAQVPFIGLRDEPELIAALTPSQRDIASEYRADLCNSIAVVFQKFITSPSPTKSPSAAPTLAPATPVPTDGDNLVAGFTEEIPEYGTVFECADEDDCNVNVPSLDESSGWTSVGYCGDGTDMGDCPAKHDEDGYYYETDQVTLVGLPEDGIVFACIEVDACNGNGPSLDPDSGWESQGNCGEDTSVICPELYDTNGQYDEEDIVTLLPESVKAAPLVIDVLGSVVDYRKFDAEAGDPYYNAENIMLNKANNGVSAQVMSGFGKLSVMVMGSLVDDITSEGKKRNLRMKNDSRELQMNTPTMGTLDQIVVTDVECPEGLAYAPEKGYCLNFQFKILPDNALAQDEAMANKFVSMMKMHINEIGTHYDKVYAANPETIIMGLGNPGRGIDYLYEEPIMAARATPEPTSSGLSTGAIVGIILAIVLIPIAILAMYARHKRQQEKERLRRLAEYEDAKRDIEAAPPAVPDEPEYVPEPEPPEQEPGMGAGPEEDEESDEPSVWSESSEETGFEEEDRIVENEANAVPEATTGSALAAMGTIGAVVSLQPDRMRGSSSDDESNASSNIRNEVAALVEDKPAPVATPTRNVDSPPDAASPISPSNIDEELLSRMQSRKSGMAGAAVATKVHEAQESPAKSNKGIDQEELISRMEARSNTSETQAAAAAAPEKKMAPAASSSARFVDSELAARMEQNKEKESLHDEVVQLVEATKPGKSADDLLRAYKGRERDLIHSLRKLKSVKENKGNTSPEK